MLKYRNEDITTVTQGVIAHGVNTCHAMGSGVAKAIYTKWPEVREKYMALDKQELGNVQYIRVAPYLWVANCFTQPTYGRVGVHAVPNEVFTCMELVVNFSMYAGQPIHMPRIGCGLGGLSWQDNIEQFMIRLADERNVEIIVYEYP